MGKQDKKIKKAKAGKAKAEKIIEETVEKVTAKPSLTSKYDSERVEGCSDEDFALVVLCLELREEGEPWWAIARAMELPGAGDSATTGKKGASKARNVYKAAFGSFPRTFKTGVYKGKAERNEQVRELQRQKKAERRAIAKAGKSVISPDTPDEEVADMLKGRRIKWWVQSDIVPEGMEMEACIHPKTPLYIEGEGEDRVIEFREQHRKAPVEYRLIPAHTRTVRLRSIFEVK
jgi:hypothetical protein